MIMACGGRHRVDPDRQLGNRTGQEGSHMATIATDDGTSSAHRDSAYSGLPNKLVRVHGTKRKPETQLQGQGKTGTARPGSARPGR
jgi:hypothetical protein